MEEAAKPAKDKVKERGRIMKAEAESKPMNRMKRSMSQTGGSFNCFSCRKTGHLAKDVQDNSLVAIDLHNEREAVVNLLVCISEPGVCGDMVGLWELTRDLWERQGVCLAKGLLPLTPEACNRPLVMAGSTDQDMWLGRPMTVGRVGSTNNCKVHGLEDNILAKSRLESVQQVREGGSCKSADQNLYIGPKLILEEHEEMLALL